MRIEAFYDSPTSTFTYLVYDEATGDAVLIDPVLDFDAQAVSTTTASVDALIARTKALGLTVHLALDTHVHADHLTGLDAIKRTLGCPIAIGDGIQGVQEMVQGMFAADDLPTDGRPFDVLMQEGTPFHAGSLVIEAIHTPGHTPACHSYKIGDALFTGDTMFMPDFGTGRCDFPGGSAEVLYDSVQKLYALPDSTRVFVGHDYQPGGRELRHETTIGEAKDHNIQLGAHTTREAFVAFRSARDATLSPPRLLFQSLQVNADGGRLPEPDAKGRRFLKLPIGVFD